MGVSCFLADVHLGLELKDYKAREVQFISLLDNLPQNTTDLYLLGDIFDFWYEWKHVIPSKYARVVGALARVSARGIKIHYFTGNHDIWLYRFFQQEIGAQVLKKPEVVEIDGKRLFLAHGDALWYNPLNYRLLQKLFKCRFAQHLFSSLVPTRVACWFGYNWSKHNRINHDMSETEFVSLTQKVKDGALKWAQEYQNSLPSDQKIDYFIMGHFHTPFTAEVPGGGKFYLLGDWIRHADYILFDGNSLEHIKL